MDKQSASPFETLIPLGPEEALVPAAELYPYYSVTLESVQVLIHLHVAKLITKKRRTIPFGRENGAATIMNVRMAVYPVLNIMFRDELLHINVKSRIKSASHLMRVKLLSHGRTMMCEDNLMFGR